MLLAIDPGADQGWAVFDADTRQLLSCGLGVPPEPSNGIERVCVERPMIYPGGRQKARPRDIITLAVRAGETAGPYRKYGAQIDYYEPAEWKQGSISKDIHHARLWAKLSLAEQEIIRKAARGVARSKQHNIMDAVGIGMFAVVR